MRGILTNGITMQNLSKITLQPASVFPELYEPIWWYSGQYATNTGGVGSASGSNLVAKGATSNTNVYTGSNTALITLNSRSPASQKYALEASLWSSNSSTSYAQLWDITTNSAVTGAQISTSSTTATVLRSSQFTLTPGHKYGITIWDNSGGANRTWLTDASLIVFPSSPLTSPSVSAISLANPSGNGLKESYIPLWVYSSGTATNSSSLTGNVYLIQKGSTSSVIYSSATSSAKLFTLSSTWSPSQKFVLETSTYSASGTNVSAVSELYDFNTSSLVSASQISLSYTTTATLLRSGTFTLTTGHTYGVALGPSTGGNSVYLTKAHLVALA